MESLDKARLAAKALEDKKASDVKILNVTEITSLGEYFVIASASSAVQARACAGEVEEKLSEAGEELLHREGRDSGSWILLDFGSVIIHVMLEETREFYDLERLWADAEQVEINAEGEI